MRRTGELDPQQIEDVAGFIAALCRLKERSGLTYRQLEKQAAERGEVLPRSTLANVLGGKTSPRPELLAAFVRACGDGERAAQWLETWEELAGRDGRAAESDIEGPARHVLSLPTSHRGLALLVLVVVTVSVAATVWMWVSDGTSDSNGQARGGVSASPSVWPSLPSGRVRIRPVLAEGLCLTDGRVRGYEPFVAVQRPCDEVAPQETLLEPLGGNSFRIQWYHPDHGKGCLKALVAKPLAGLLEPWEACEQSSRFRIEPTGPEGSGHYVLRVSGEGCVGMAGTATSEGAEARLGPCRGKPGQQFIIESAP
ncbi:helix-turn-helix transcriptional regulator [Streptomyces sp. NPDC006624]|uniref:helix-turn-helix transcriptional regulator n=1 Tax=unclassified Streptomyces TaxID=2593676 RepID=UPI0033B7FEF4